MAKKSIRDLLGITDDRVEVDLNLGTPRLRNPIERAGNYGVYQQRVQKNNLTRLAESLGKINPMLMDYGKLQNQQKELQLLDAKTDFVKEKTGLLEAQTQLVDFKSLIADPATRDKALTDLKTQQGKTQAEIDKYFRNNYGLNPLASIRAQKLLGATSEAAYLAFRNEKVTDFKNNMTGLITQEEIEEFVYGLADEFLAQEGVNIQKGSLAHQGFMEAIQKQTGEDIATLKSSLDEYHVTNIGIPSVANNVFRAYEKSMNNMSEAVAALKESWRNTGMFNTEQQAKVLSTAFALIPAEDKDEAEDFLEALTEAGIKIGTQPLTEGNIYYESLEQDIEDRYEKWEVDNERELSDAHNENITDYTRQLNDYYDVGNTKGAMEYLNKIEQEIRDEVGDGTFTEYQNKTLSWISTQRYSQDAELIKRYQVIQSRSGLDDDRTRGLLQKAVSGGHSLFKDEYPELVTVLASLQEETAVPFEYDIVNDSYQINMEGHHDFAPVRAKWQAATEKALQEVLAMGLDPQEAGKVYKERQEIIDNTFVSDLQAVARDYYINKAKATQVANSKASVETTKTVIDTAGQKMFQDNGDLTKRAFKEIFKLKKSADDQLELDDAQTFYAFGAGALESGNEKTQSEFVSLNQTIMRESLVNRRHLETRADLIRNPRKPSYSAFSGNSLNGTPVVNEKDYIRMETNRKAAYNKYVAGKSQEYEDALRFHVFQPNEVLDMLESLNARGNTTGMLYHPSGFRISPDFFKPENLVYIQGLSGDDETTQKIARLLNTNVDDLLNYQEQLRKIREQ